MTPQVAYETIVAGLLRQGRKSWSDSNCRYRGEDGTKCAAGFLIPDDLYEPEMEGHLFEYVLRHWPRLQHFLQLDDYTIMLVHHCQIVHDSRSPKEWRDNLRTVGENYGLNTSVCERIYS